MGPKTKQVAQYKKDTVAQLKKYMLEYPVIALVDMENLPAPQLQVMRSQLRGKVVIAMTKQRLMKVAFADMKEKVGGIEQLPEHLRGMPALLFTKDNPFLLFKTLKQSKSKAAAKAGQTAPFDLIVPKGPTGFAPGPIIGELATANIAAGVEDGKVVIKADSLVVKGGEIIDGKTAELLARLGVEPMEVGLNITAVLENNQIYTSKVLDIDEEQFVSDLANAARWGYNLAFEAAWPTKENITQLIGKAFRDSRGLGLSQNIMASGLVEELIGKASREAASVQATAGIEVGTANEEKKEAAPIKIPVDEAASKKKKGDKKENKEPEQKEEEPVEKEAEAAEKKPEKEAPEVKAEPKDETPAEPEPVTEEPKQEAKGEPKEDLVEAANEDSKADSKEEVSKEEPVEEAKPAVKDDGPEQVMGEVKEQVGVTAKEEPQEDVSKEGQPVKEEPNQEPEKKQDPEPEVPKEAPEPSTDDKIAAMVQKTKQHETGDIPSAVELVEGTNKGEAAPASSEPALIEPEQESLVETPLADAVPAKEKIDVLEKKAEPNEEDTGKKEEERKAVEDLTQELLKKGTLRK